MKLLLDENLSRRLVPLLEASFPGSSQVVLAGLERASDTDIWKHARDNGFVIVSNDSDFEEMSLLLGAPPHVIRLSGENLSNAETLRLLADSRQFIVDSVEAGVACIEIFKRSGQPAR